MPVAALAAVPLEVASSLPGTTGMPASFIRLRARTLSPRLRIKCGAGPTQTRPASTQAWAKAGFLRKEAVAGLDGVRAGLASGLDEPFAVEVALLGGRGPDGVGLVGVAHVERVAVRLGVDGDGADA